MSVLFIVSTHAAQRYVERVKPDMEVDQAKREILLVAESVGVLQQDPPGWLVPAEEHKPLCWLLLGDSVAFPILRSSGDGRLVLRTCLVQGYVSEAYRDAKRWRRRKRRGRRRDLPGPRPSASLDVEAMEWL